MAITISFSTHLYSGTDIVTLRNSADGWGTDVQGSYMDYAWVFQLDGPQYEEGFEFKFFLQEQQAWSSGPNLTVPANTSGSLSYDADTVRFLFFIELHPGDYSLRTFSLQSDVDEWSVDLPASTTDVDPEWGLEWGKYRDGLEFKFVLTIGKDETGSVRTVWMMNDNISLKPVPGTYYTYYGAHQGPIIFPFFVRFITERYAQSRITLRDQANNWQDRLGSYEDGAWLFSIPWTDYFNSATYGPVAFRAKFALDGKWMNGPNIQIGPDEVYQGNGWVEVGMSYDFGEDRVQFQDT